jgi:hypothetical protein
MAAPVAATALVFVLVACGSDPPVVGPTPTPTPPPCTQTAVHTNSGPIPSLTLVFADFPVADSGRLDMTLDWTNASSPMGLYLVPAGTCTLAEFNQRTCNFLVRSDPPGPKPRKVSSANNLQAGNYRYIVANYSGDSESAAVQIVLSKGTCPAVANVPPTTAAYLPGSALTVERAQQR